MTSILSKCPLRISSVYQNAPRFLTSFFPKAFNVVPQLLHILNCGGVLFAFNNYGGSGTVDKKHIEP